MNQEPVIHPSGDISLANFAFLSDDAQKQLTEALGLSMLQPTLQLCREYYKKVGRDPAAEELFLFDKLSKNGLKRVDHVNLSEMYTNSDEAAALFADLMSHRGTKHRGGDSTRLSLSDLAEIVGSVAKESNGSAFEDVGIGFTLLGDWILASKGYRRVISTGNAPEDLSVGVRAASTGEQKPAVGDYVYFLRPKQSAEDEGKHFTDFLLKHVTRGTVKYAKVLTADSDGLLSTLLDLGCGLTLHPGRMLGSEEFKLIDLEEYRYGTVIVASPTKSADLLLDAMSELASLTHVATVEKDDSLRILRNGKAVGYPLAFLRSLLLSRAFCSSLTLSDANDFSARIARRGLCDINGRPCALVRTVTRDRNPFRSVVLSTVWALSHCVCMGGSLRDTRWELHLSADANFSGTADFDGLLSALLGAFFLYRGLPLTGGAPTVDLTELDGLTATSVVLSALRSQTPSAFANTPGAGIYYLEPRYEENGLPDLEDLKRMYAYVEALMADGKVRAARPVFEKLLTSLDEMSREKTIEYLLDIELPVRVGGILIETEYPIEGTLVARTEADPIGAEEDAKNSDETETRS